ncbi:MAG TPA: anti-sigma factor [Gaiellaceae bacterium]|jgi:anti-sigma-K factor RskA|nr:anti-sigma factor [Gaiellaceae bacterium]
MDLHDLTAAYALDALAPDEAEAYERHLAQCEECRQQLAELNEGAAALAFEAAAPAPPPRLREAILEQAAAERSNVVPLVRRRWVSRGLAVAAAAAACVAVGLGVSLSQSSHKVVFTVVVDRFGNGTMNVSGLSSAPHGKTYEAWVIPVHGAPRPAGLFRGGPPTTLPLQTTVPRGAVVAVTRERAGGVNKPTEAPILSAKT